MNKRQKLFQEWLWCAMDELDLTGDAEVAEEEFDTLLFAFIADLHVVAALPDTEVGH